MFRKLDGNGNSQEVVLALAFVSGSVVNTRIELADFTVAFEDRDEGDEITGKKDLFSSSRAMCLTSTHLL